jgi:hypothetical protein
MLSCDGYISWADGPLAPLSILKLRPSTSSALRKFSNTMHLLNISMVVATVLGVASANASAAKEVVVSISPLIVCR